MKKTIAILTILVSILSCSKSNSEDTTWKKTTRESKTIGNITYYFPSEVTLKDRQTNIALCQKAVTENLELLKEKAFTNKMDIEFLHSRTEMKKHTGMAAQGMACFQQDTFYTILKEKNSPIKHEMNHMIAFYKWGIPAEDWMAEGLGTYSGGTCSDYTLEEIYQYLLQSKKILAMDILVNDFWRKGNNDIITYTQSGFIVKYLLDNYGYEKFKLLWIKGFKDFKTIYGMEFQVVDAKIKQELKLRYPKNIVFNWEAFNKGCQ